MIAPVPNIQEQLATLASRLIDAISQAGEQVTAINERLKKLGKAYTDDPQAFEHIDIFRNNVQNLDANAAYLKILAPNNQSDKAQIIEMLGKIAGWKEKDSHRPVKDGHLHVLDIPHMNIESATRDMTRYIASMIDKLAETMDTTDTAPLTGDYNKLNKTIGLIYRHTEAAGKLEAKISSAEVAIQL